MRTRTIENPYESNFLGLFEGKRKKAKAEAKIAIIEAQAEAERQKYMMEYEAALKGYTPEKDKADAAIELEETKQKSETILYGIIGFAVVAVMFGLYFIKKR